MQRLIVTADDYGMCDAVDRAIEAGIENGFITTTNVMLNMESLHHASDLRSRYPHISVGVHWNVTTGKPICAPQDVPTLVDEAGCFWPVSVFKKRFRQGLISSADLKKELEAQYRLFEEYCGKADYWNAHENSCLQKDIFRVFQEVALSHDVKATRTFQRVYYDKVNLGLKRQLRELLAKTYLHWWFKKIRKTFAMPVARVISFDKISKTEGDILLKALQKDGRDCIEVVFHPATVAEHPYFGNISEKRVQEYQFVSSAEVYQRYKAAGFEFVSFEVLI